EEAEEELEVLALERDLGLEQLDRELTRPERLEPVAPTIAEEQRLAARAERLHRFGKAREEHVPWALPVRARLAQERRNEAGDRPLGALIGIPHRPQHVSLVLELERLVEREQRQTA